MTKVSLRKSLKSETCEALLSAGTEVILEKGYNHAGLDEILKRANAQKGSFYHFFANKEEFGLRVIDRQATIRFARLDGFLADETRTPLNRLRQFFEDSCLRHESNGFRRGCLFGNLGQEMADQSEPFRQQLNDRLTEFRGRITSCLVLAQAQGELRPDLDAERLADYCLNSWEGALLRMKVVRSRLPLDEFIRVTFDLILRPGDPA